MELRHLRYFVAVAELLHFGRAAERLRVAQPSLSHQIQQLEAELQTKLLDRTQRRVRLTAAGRILLGEAREILARADQAAVMTRRASREEAHELRVGLGYCMDPSIVTAVLRAYQRRDPTVRLEVETMAVAAQIAALRDGRLEVGLVRQPVSDPAISSATLVAEGLVAALRRDHPLAVQERIALSALAESSFVLVPRVTVPVLHDILLEACREAGFVPHAPHQADQLNVLLGMVAVGMGVALVPASARKLGVRGVVLRPLQASPVLETGLAWRRESGHPAVSAFVEVARGALTGAARLR